MTRQKQPSIPERLRNLERRVAELEAIEKYRQRVYRQVRRDLERAERDFKKTNP